MPTVSNPKFFKSPEAFGRWLESNHSSAQELWVGFHRKSTGKPSLTWAESVDEALCFGWIDGIRKTVDEARYAIRFTPRRPGSNWSSINIQRARALIKEGRMRPAGLTAFEDRHKARAEGYSYENRPRQLPSRYLKVLKANKAAWAFYRDQPPGYRRSATWWVLSAKREETRLKRLSALIRDAAEGRRVRQLSQTPRPD